MQDLSYNNPAIARDSDLRIAIAKSCSQLTLCCKSSPTAWRGKNERMAAKNFGYFM